MFITLCRHLEHSMYGLLYIRISEHCDSEYQIIQGLTPREALEYGAGAGLDKVALDMFMSRYYWVEVP
jgi:hypothetical protein